MASEPEGLYRPDMNRSISDFDQDEHGHWRAVLNCGHRQHMRHDPPMTSRPWVLSPEGRQTMIGTEVDCVRCNQLEIPADYVIGKTTDLFTARTVPAPLLQDHRLGSGKWGRLVVRRGSVVMVFNHPALGERSADSKQSLAIPPEIPHKIRPTEDAEFVLEFYERGN